ncbi:MAG: hypothetical protein WDN06_16965 [Asticcacaulis sp.]
MNRRAFLAGSAAALALPAMAQASAPEFRAADAGWQAAYDKGAGDPGRQRSRPMPRYSKPVLIEGSVYQGIWNGMRSARGPDLPQVPPRRRPQQPRVLFRVATHRWPVAMQQQGRRDRLLARSRWWLPIAATAR